MNTYKICLWLNVPSNHQTLFLEALHKSEQIDLKVCYFDKQNLERLKLGWRKENALYLYENYVPNLNDIFNTITDWKERIHVVIGYGYSFNRHLIPLLINNNIKWIHWSERYGIILTNKLHHNVKLFNLFRPLFLLTKRSYAKLVNKYAIGCFSQGILAQKDFIYMGISRSKITDLFYTNSPILKTKFFPKILREFNFDYKFLYVGKLCERKGITDLIHAFSKLKNFSSWGLVLIGQDLSYGAYEKLSFSLGINQQVLFIDTVKESTLNQYYSHCDIFILPSRFDGWGVVLNEAASIGMALIGSNQAGASHHLIQNNKNGYIFEAANVENLSKIMQKYVFNPELITKHGYQSKQLFKNFSPKKNVERFINAISHWSKDI